MISGGFIPRKHSAATMPSDARGHHTTYTNPTPPLPHRLSRPYINAVHVALNREGVFFVKHPM